LYAFGEGENKQLGQKEQTNEWMPKVVAAFGSGREILDIAAGRHHVVAVCSVTGILSACCMLSLLNKSALIPFLRGRCCGGWWWERR